MIACVRVPYFAAAIERREDPALRELPLIIGGPRQVYATSLEPARMGVRPGMPLRRAHTICPSAHFVIPAVHSRYQQALEQVLDLLALFSSRVEPGEGYWQVTDGRWRTRERPAPLAAAWYLDVGPAKRSDAAEMAACIGQTVREESRLAPAVGLARTRFTAYVAATSLRPNRARVIPPGGEAAFLAPLPIEHLPLDREMARQLHLLGIRTIGQLAALPAGAVLARFGRQGQAIHWLAQGRDDRPLRPHRPRAVARAARHFDDPVASRPVVEAALRSIAEELAAQMRALAGRELWVTVHLEGGAVREGKVSLRQPSARADQLARVLSGFLARARVLREVVGLEVTLAGAVPETGQQLDLFAHGTGQAHQLRAALKDLVARYGAGCFYKASLVDRGGLLPERRFRLEEAAA